MAFKVLATADLHLGRMSSRIPPEKRKDYAATTNILDQIVNTARQQRVDAVVMAGDVIDQDNNYIEVYNDLRSALRTLTDNGITVVMTAGNHDYNSLTEFVTNLKGDLSTDRIHLLGAHGTWTDVTLQNEGGDQLQCIGWSFDRSHVHESPLSDLDTGLISNSIPTLGLIHGEFDPNSSYAPFDQGLLLNLPVEGWVIGHIHIPDMRSERPFLAYPGSPQALSPKETGPHGVHLLEIAGSGEVTVNFKTLSPVAYEYLDIRLEPDLPPDQFRTHCIDRLRAMDRRSELNVINVNLTGRTTHLDKLGDLIEQLAGTEIRSDLYVDRVQNYVEPAIDDLDTLAQRNDPLGMVAGALIAQRDDQEDPFLEEFRDHVKQLQQNIDAHNTYMPLHRVILEESDEDGGSPAQLTEDELEQVIHDELWRVLYQLHQQKQEDTDA
jgi:exonuclease SbcD